MLRRFPDGVFGFCAVPAPRPVTSAADVNKPVVVVLTYYLPGKSKAVHLVPGKLQRKQTRKRGAK
jgi:hypothetical protein